MNLQDFKDLMASPAGEWVGALGIAAAIILASVLAKTWLLRKLSEMSKHTGTQIDDAVVKMLGATKVALIVLLALYAGSHNVNLPAKVFKALDVGATIALFVQLGLWLAALVDFGINRQRQKAMASNVGAATSLSALGFIAQFVLWVMVTLLMLDNLGVNITALVAGLGIGGIAVALAVQNVLGDVFASLSIVIDKPFVIGDFVIVDDYMGTVENVGLKTTRIRSLGGEQIIFSNSDLLKARVRNYKRMYERRILFGFDVIYDTPPEQLAAIPEMVRKIVERQKKVRFERAHFTALKENSLHFEVVYWVMDPDYGLYADIQQAINLDLLRTMAEARVLFAYNNAVMRPATLAADAAVLAKTPP